MTGYQAASSMLFHPAFTSTFSMATDDFLSPNPTLMVRDGSRVGLADNTLVSIDADAKDAYSAARFNATYNTIAGYWLAIQNALYNGTYSITVQDAMMPNLGVTGPEYGNSTKPAWSYCTISQAGDYCTGYNARGGGWSYTRPPKDAPEVPTPAMTWSNMSLHGQDYVLQPPPLDIVWAVPADSWSLTLGEGNGNGYGYFSNESIASTAVCQPITNYQWGFSSILLFLFCCMTIAFAAVVLILEIDVYLHSRSNQYNQRRDTYRSALEVTQALIEEFGVKEVEEHPDTIGRKVHRHTGGLSVDTDGLPCGRRSQPGSASLIFRRRGVKDRQEATHDLGIAMYEPLTHSRSAGNARKEDTYVHDIERTWSGLDSTRTPARTETDHSAIATYDVVR